MAHWVGILNEPSRQVFVGKTKQEVMFSITSAMTNRSRYLASAVKNQLATMREVVAVAYGKDQEEIAKVFQCNCGSVKKHLQAQEEEKV